MNLLMLKQKVLQAIMCGPLNGVKDRIDKVFEDYEIEACECDDSPDHKYTCVLHEVTKR